MGWIAMYTFFTIAWAVATRCHCTNLNPLLTYFLINFDRKDGNPSPMKAGLHKSDSLA